MIRRFRTIPIGQKAVFIDLPVQWVECSKCRAVRQVKVRFAGERKGYTRASFRICLIPSLELSTYFKIGLCVLSVPLYSIFKSNLTLSASSCHIIILSAARLCVIFDLEMELSGGAKNDLNSAIFADNRHIFLIFNHLSVIENVCKCIIA
ncbi:hypothetical protein [Nitrosomonas communis]|uniref:Uncharacterized protein n=1 Tax=Nitrosomonas communis TaxID=44574 RepID=A0A1I4RDV1_9PROT|nr:hypothetical protein SAMN05421863_103222 [Nitrosomonas communis]